MYGAEHPMAQRLKLYLCHVDDNVYSAGPRTTSRYLTELYEVRCSCSRSTARSTRGTCTLSKT